MIPRGRTVVTAAQVAELAGVPLRTWRRRDAPAFEQVVPSLFHGRYLIYDLEQTRAFLSGRPIPTLPDGEHATDFLNDKEAADLLNVEPSTIRAYRRQGYLPPGLHPTGPDGLPITSIRVTARRDLAARRASLPPSHVPRRAGRPTGSKLQARATTFAEQRLTAEDIADELGISRRHANRLIQNSKPAESADERSQRTARIQRLLAGAEPPPSLQEIAKELGISKTQAHRLVHAIRDSAPGPADADTRL